MTLVAHMRMFPRPLLLACALAGIPFFFVWGQGHLLYDFDMTFITAPIEDMFARYQRAGQLPLWAPELQGGYPLIAISHLGFFYPFHALLRTVLPGVLTLNISLLVHVLLATVGMYGMLRNERYRPDAAAFGALTFSGTGFLVGHLYLTNVMLPLLWVPVHLWLLGRWLGRGQWLALLGLSVAMACQILLGQPQAALIGTVALALYAVAHLAERSLRRTILRFLPLIPAAALTVLLAYAQIGPTLALVPYSDRADAILENELYEFSFPLHHVVSWVFPHAFGYREQYIGGKNETELATWFGVTVLLLAIVGVMSPRRAHRRALLFALLSGVGALVMSSGTFSPLYRYLVEQQYITSLAIPARWMFLLVLSIVVLSAHGFEVTEQLPRRKKSIRTTLALLGVVCLLIVGWTALPPSLAPLVWNNLFSHPLRTATPAIVALTLVWMMFRAPHRLRIVLPLLLVGELLVPNLVRNVHVPFARAFHRSRIEDILRQEHEPQLRVFTQRDLSILPPPSVGFKPLKRLDRSFTVRQRFVSQNTEILGLRTELRWGKEPPREGTVRFTLRDEHSGREETRSLSIAEAGDGRTLLVRMRPFKEVLGHSFLLTISTSETVPGPWVLVAISKQGHDVLPGGHAELCEGDRCRSPSLSGVVAEQLDLVLSPIYEDEDQIYLAQEMLAPHIAAGKGFQNSQWLGALQLHDVKRYLYAIGDQNENAVGFNPFLQARRSMVDRFSIGSFIGSTDDGRPLGMTDGVEVTAEYPVGAQTVRLYKNLHAYPRVEFVPHVVSVSHPDSALAVLENADTPRDLVVVEDDLQVKDAPLHVGNVSVVSYTPTTVMLQTHNVGPGFLVFRDVMFPSWTADIDGTPTRIYPTDVVFRGVLVPAGDHVVTFRYTPHKTLQAIRISAVSWGGVLCSALLGTIIRRQRKRSRSLRV